MNHDESRSMVHESSPCVSLKDFLKQSATRINFIGDKVVAMTLEMYRTPRHMVETLSALGLRHVGYAIPTEMQLGSGVLGVLISS